MLVALSSAGCGLRLDTAPPEAPNPDPAEELRQEAAARTATLAATVGGVTDPEDGAAVLERVAVHADVHLDALGGVWVAWPGGAPEGATPPPPPPTAPVDDPSAADVVELLATGASEAREAAVAAPTEDLAVLLASVSLSRSRGAADLATAVGAPPVEPAAAPMNRDTLLARGVDGPTVQVLDQARYAYEAVAARTSEVSRESAKARADHLQLLVDVAIEAGAPDARLGVYSLPGADEEAGLNAEQAAAVRAETLLLEHWLFSLGRADADLRPALLDAAAAAAARILEWGGTLPALPGLPRD
ncbi:hypothetical protein GCM10023169_19200 [Georgenia halophila]|uniref:DUF4439 domain-containing protein n=1 Tax=Georgenia halophila TaxID=620889 RepID=A0ABP8L750_9MICO